MHLSEHRTFLMSFPHESAPRTMREVFVGRQPIYDRQLDVVAYELLFRSSEENQAGSQ